MKADAVSGATVEGGMLEGVANNEFKPFTVYVRNATPETEITITSADMASSTDDVRFFLDDIVLEVEGEPQRPSTDDPVKTDVSVVRAMKGAGTVTTATTIIYRPAWWLWTTFRPTVSPCRMPMPVSSSSWRTTVSQQATRLRWS